MNDDTEKRAHNADSEPSGFEDAAVSALHWEAGELLKWLSTHEGKAGKTNEAQPDSNGPSLSLTQHLEGLLELIEVDATLARMLEELPVLLGSGIWLQPVYSHLFPGTPHPLAVTLPPTSEKLNLGSREREILQEMARGRTRKEIAEQLFISPATVKKHFENIYKKLDAAGPQQAVLKATALGLLDFDITDFMQLMREKLDMDYSSFGYALFRGLIEAQPQEQYELSRKVASLGLLIFLLVPLAGSIRSNYGFGRHAESRGCILEFDAGGQLLRRFGEELNLRCPRDLAFAPPSGRHGFTGGNLFVLDGMAQPDVLNLDGIVELTPQGGYVRTFTGGRYLSSSLVQAWNMAFTVDGRLLVTNAISTDAVLEITQGGDHVRHFTDLIPYGGLAVDAQNNVYVVGGWRGDSPIRVFDARGRSLRTVGQAKKGVYEGLAVDKCGNLLAANAVDNCVDIYDSQGNLTGTAGRGYLNNPQRLAVDENGRLHVLDSGGRRLQAFSANGKPAAGFDAPPGVRMNGLAMGPAGTLYVAAVQDTGETAENRA